MINPEQAILRLSSLLAQCRILESDDGREIGTGSELRREELFDMIQSATEEVALTPMRTLTGIACKAAYLSNILDETDGDLAGTLARTLTEDVIAMSTDGQLK